MLSGLGGRHRIRDNSGRKENYKIGTNSFERKQHHNAGARWRWTRRSLEGWGCDVINCQF